MNWWDIHWLGLSEENGRRFLVSLVFVAAVAGVRGLLRGISVAFLKGESPRQRQAHFWIGQSLNVLAALVIVLGLLSIWFDDPARLATALGLFSAGLAFALQRVITAIAGYVVILRGNNFTVGDRILMGNVRGDVLALGFTQTTLMEMGAAPGSDAGPNVWVRSRQFTGRIVTVSNAKIFDDPVYNYTREFPYIWEEINVPLRYEDDRAAAEAILLAAARRHAVDPKSLTEEAARTLERRFDLRRLDFEPRVYYSLTSHGLDLSLRFVSRDHGTRGVKDQIARDVLAGFDKVGLRVAAVPYRIVELPAAALEGFARGTASLPPAAP